MTCPGSPTVSQFIRHAQLFGTELVFETASENGFSELELERLRIELDAIEAARKSGRFTVGRRRRRAPDETVRAARQLRSEGLVVAAIADKLGISDAHVKRCLNRSSTVENRPANPHGYGAVLALKSEVG
jgi:hypothetical protein